MYQRTTVVLVKKRHITYPESTEESRCIFSTYSKQSSRYFCSHSKEMKDFCRIATHRSTTSKFFLIKNVRAPWKNKCLTCWELKLIMQLTLKVFHSNSIVTPYSSISEDLNNFKCLTIFDCDDLNKKDTVVSVDLIDVKLFVRNYWNRWKFLRNLRKS